jgi:plasmid stabilization system protein ParE
MIKVEFHPEAEHELLEARLWYRERSKLAARAFATDIAASLRYIVASPSRSREDESGERRFVLSKFPFSIIYHVTGNVVFVTAVAHQKRRPGYWRTRQPD